MSPKGVYRRRKRSRPLTFDLSDVVIQAAKDFAIPVRVSRGRAPGDHWRGGMRYAEDILGLLAERLNDAGHHDAAVWLKEQRAITAPHPDSAPEPSEEPSNGD